MSSTTIPMTEEQWLAERKLGIGGSEVHNLFPSLDLNDKDDPGSRYGCPRRLSYEKLDVKPDFEYSPETLRLFERGHILEDFAADRYMEKTGRRVFRANRPIVSEVLPFQRVNIDRRIQKNDLGQRGTLECKSANEHSFRRMIVEGLPIGYALQLQHSLSVTTDVWGSFAVIEAPDYLDAVIEQIPDGRLRNAIIRELAPKFDFFHFDCVRDENLIGVIVEKEAAFWSLTEAGKLADPLPDIKDERCSSCTYRRTCRGQAYADANAKVPVRDKKTGVQYVQIDNPKFAEIVADRLEVMKVVEEQEQLLKAIDNELKQNFPPEVGAVQVAGTDVKIRWNYQKGAMRWDSEALKADAKTIGKKLAFADWIRTANPELMEEFEEAAKDAPSLTDKYQVQSAPTRPFVVAV